MDIAELNRALRVFSYVLQFQREVAMGGELSKDETVRIARDHFSQRIGAQDGDIKLLSIEDVTFPDSNFGASKIDEMSLQVLTDGWRILLGHKEKKAEYRANQSKVRLYQFEGTNYRIFP